MLLSILSMPFLLYSAFIPLKTPAGQETPFPPVYSPAGVFSGIKAESRRNGMERIDKIIASQGLYSQMCIRDRVELDHKDGKIKSGMMAEVSFTMAASDDTIPVSYTHLSV